MKIQSPFNVVRPSRTTYLLIFVGIILVLTTGIFSFLQSKKLTSSQATLTSTEAKLATTTYTVNAFANEDTLKGQALFDATNPAETLLPNTDTSPVESFAAIEASARAAGLRTSGLSSALDYSLPPSAEIKYYPGLYSATGALRVEGSIALITSWLTSLDEFPQILTYITNGIVVSEGTSTLDMQLKLWASDFPEWSNGVPLNITPKKYAEISTQK